MIKPMKITKTLSSNDTGETGGHQAGILVPKQKEILDFFPDLGNSEKNPRAVMLFEDGDGRTWSFSFIYYNNRFFDKSGTRNEYRLTGMTAYFRQNDLKAGDILFLSRDEYGQYSIRYERKKDSDANETLDKNGMNVVHLKLSGKWKIVNY